MVEWSNRPIEGLIQNTFDIVRTPPKPPLTLIVTSTEAFGKPVHFWMGRSTPCLYPEFCEPCEKGRAYRWRAYLAAIESKSQDHVIWECTAPIHLKLSKVVQEIGSLRGCKLICSRIGGRENGRLAVQVFRPQQVPDGLPKAPDVRQVMEHVWTRKLDGEISNPDGNGSAEPVNKTKALF